MKDTIVIDLDGTLSDGRARYHLVSGKRRDYPAFHARLEEDPVNDWCRQLMGWTDARVHVVIVSARPKYAEPATVRWLVKHDVYYHELHLLRADDADSTPDQELKRAWVRAYGKERILFTVDDRQKVVDMWREEGLTCLQCAAWGGDARPAPRFVYLPQTVRGDFLFAGTYAPPGVYEAHVNGQGAVSVRATNGRMLGVKPGEYQDVEGATA